MRLQRALVLISLVSISCLRAQSPSVFGDWQEPTGSILRIERCSTGVCMRVVHLGSRALGTFDIHNPDPAKRTRSLCNLEIGSGFQLGDSAHAAGGKLYDPKSGRTYRGNMAVEGNDLRLRGYIGSPIFGKTETWRRVTGSPPMCMERGNQ